MIEIIVYRTVFPKLFCNFTAYLNNKKSLSVYYTPRRPITVSFSFCFQFIIILCVIPLFGGTNYTLLKKITPWFPYYWGTLSQISLSVSEKMLTFAFEFGGVCRAMRKAFVLSEVEISPKKSRGQDTERLFAFSCMYWLLLLHIVKHRMKFFSVLLWNGVWRCLNFVKQTTWVLCFPCNIS